MGEKFPINGILNLLETEDDFVFLESARVDAENFLSYLFLRPQKIISTRSIDEVESCFRELDQALKDGNYLAGYLSYEAGEAFEERLRSGRSFDFPLVWFGVYKQPLIYNHRQQAFENSSLKLHSLIKKIILGDRHRGQNYRLKNIRQNISQNSYLSAIAKIKDLIAQGLTYQVNYTFKLKFSFSGSAAKLYLKLRNNQGVGYAAFIKSGCSNILSFSPELFFRKKGPQMLARPMKGTASRGRDFQEDQQICRQLENCLKNRSENVMIVDLLRNDLGKVSATASVKVPRLFNIERYQTLFQMTSDIKSRLRAGHSAFDILRGIFPSGSVTGAPKIKTMEIIRGLEKDQRRVYTGSIGFFSPDQSGTFNVAIRTLLINSQTKTGEMGVGSGIVYDSDPLTEYAECCLKADFLTKETTSFQLIETMRCGASKGYLLLEEHLKRLEDSARYFGFVYNRNEILLALEKLQRTKTGGITEVRVRLLLNKDGSVELESSLLPQANNQQPKVCLSAQKINSQSPFLYHKTTCRKIYDRAHKFAQTAGYYDIIFTNERGEITEGAISNIFVRKNGKLYTPPVNCGLLPGVHRNQMLRSKKYAVEEKALFIKDLLAAEEIYLSNSVRGLVKVHLEAKNH
ncbi:MAG: aminodeoxychorismate synthase component I [Candidatus Omnitrophica bacterium]|nr:aminodeoxychorismate synthase component I [Candidatus Omnitrophota bacterium]